MKLVAVGDAIVTRRLSRADSDDLAKVRALLSSANVAFANFENPTPRPPLVPGVLPQGMHVFAPPFAVDEVRALGIDVVSLANNHAVDYSVSGLLDTMAMLRAGDLPFAGAGSTLGEARAPVYIDTAAGRAAVIAAASSNALLSMAADPRSDVAGRPGISPLRARTEFELAPDRFAEIAAAHGELGLRASQASRVAASKSRAAVGGDGSVNIGGARFVRGKKTRVVTTPHPGDVDAVSRSIAEARAQADVVLVSLHAHEGTDDGWNSESPADFVLTACRAWIDAGADAVLGHGPHTIRGIEVYRGKPIFYSLGNFVFTLETVSAFPAEAYESQGLDPLRSRSSDYHDAAMLDAAARPKGFLAEPRFWEGIAAQVEFMMAGPVITVIPLSLERERSRSSRGVPSVAEGERAIGILRRLADLSAAFGTDVVIEEVDGRTVGRISIQGRLEDEKNE